MKLKVNHLDSGTSNGISTIGGTTSAGSLSNMLDNFWKQDDFWTYPWGTHPWTTPYENNPWRPIVTRPSTTIDYAGLLGITNMASRVKSTIADDIMTLEIDVPGIKEEQINIEVQGFLIKITGENKKTGRTLSESHTLASEWDAKTIEAELEDGILTLRVQRRPEAKPTKIPVKKK